MFRYEVLPHISVTKANMSKLNLPIILGFTRIRQFQNTTYTKCIFSRK